jgi:uncharacterized membrane protein YgaE (UPF0421/DUF939 family)
MMILGIRVWKTAIAAVLAIYIAYMIGLDYHFSAGLLAILGVEVTRKKAIFTITQRFGASLVGLAIGSFLLIILGFHIWVVGLFVLSAYPLLSKLNLKEGIVTSSVIILHVFSVGKLDSAVLLNEVQLLAIGLGIAGIVNFIYMPGSDQRLQLMRVELEQSFSAIFHSIAKHLRDPKFIWDGSELIKAEEKIVKGLALAKQNKENQLFRTDTYWLNYFGMRDQQWDAITRMMDLVAQVYAQLPHGEMVARLFDELSEDVKVEEYTGRVERAILALEARFKDLDLPATRAEFEVRSAILQLVMELKHYLLVAKKEKKRRIVS